MKNSMKLKNICEILKFFYNDTFKGILKYPLLRKKTNRYFLAISLFLLYWGYFYYNMVQLSTLTYGAQTLSENEHILYAKMTLSSYYNLMIILASIIFVFINSTIHLTNRSLFMIKTIPFEKQETQASIKIFNISIALIFFELFLIILAPALKLIPMNIFELLLTLISLHTVFISHFLILSFVYKIVLRESTGSSRFIRKLLLDLIIIFLTLMHSISIRFKIDAFISHQKFSIFQIILIALFISIISILIFIYILDKYCKFDDTFIQSRFFHINLFSSNSSISYSLLAFIRTSNFVYSYGITLLIFIILMLQNGLQESTQLLLYVLPIIQIYAISYADSTINSRKMYNLYRITAFKEYLSIIICSLVLSLPSLFTGIIILKSIDSYLYALCIFISSTVIGFLFPKSLSNINETISASLTFIVIIILTILANIKGALIPSLIILMIILYLILKKEHEVLK